jgi:hypothetical protein
MFVMRLVDICYKLTVCHKHIYAWFCALSGEKLVCYLFVFLDFRGFSLHLFHRL